MVGKGSFGVVGWFGFLFCLALFAGWKEDEERYLGQFCVTVLQDQDI